MAKLAMSLLLALLGVAPAYADAPYDLWSPERLQKIRDPKTLNLQVIVRGTYLEVFFDSEVGDAKWADSGPPYAVHTGGTIRIHGYLAIPPAGPARPALIVGHGHGGQADLATSQLIAAFGYAALSISGPRAGLSTGGPNDTEQAWISVEEIANQPSPEVSYLYHYAYAGMRALTVLEALAAVPGNPLRIDAARLGVVGASMGGQFAYYINGIDNRVKAAVAIAVAGDWLNVTQYAGSWLYHLLYYHTRNGLESGMDALNTISGCSDPTLATFTAYFDPKNYAATQHGPLLTITGSHDQFFVAPGVNTTYDAVQSAGSSNNFIKRIYVVPNGRHAVVDNANPEGTVISMIGTIDRWLKYSFAGGPSPVETPVVITASASGWMVFKASAPASAAAVTRAWLFIASQMDSTPALACDFITVPMLRVGADYYGFVQVGHLPACGPPLTSDNSIYFVAVSDASGYTVSSKMYHHGSEMEFGSDFTPAIQHWPGDNFPVPPPPECTIPAN